MPRHRAGSKKRLKYLRYIYKRDGNTCFYCGVKLMSLKDPQVMIDWQRHPPDNYPTLDHLVPTSYGGRSILSNLVAACYTCNHSKNNRFPTMRELQKIAGH